MCPFINKFDPHRESAEELISHQEIIDKDKSQIDNELAPNSQPSIENVGIHSIAGNLFVQPKADSCAQEDEDKNKPQLKSSKLSMFKLNVEQPKKEVNSEKLWKIMDGSLQNVLKIYSDQFIRAQHHGQLALKPEFNVGAFSKFLSDFGCKLSKIKINEVFNRVVIRNPEGKAILTQ